MREVYAIQEKDLQDGEIDILGVADSMDNVEVILKKYYGNYTEETPFQDYNDGMLSMKTIELKPNGEKYRITVRWFAINEI